MCGIIALISRENRDDLGSLIASGLYQQQNRGDHSAGISTIKKLPISRSKYRRDRGRVAEQSINDYDSLETVKGLGLVSQVFNESNLKRLGGYMGLGHVRYPTTGYVIKNSEKMNESEKQEIILSSILPIRQRHYKVAMVHNGDVYADSYHNIMDSFEAEGLNKATHNDIEAILTLFCTSFFDQMEYVPNNERLVNSVRDVMTRVEGSYSVATVVNNVGLVMFRDPQGRRPLNFGVTRDKNDEITNYAFASETVALDKMLFKGTKDFNTIDGLPAYDEIKPGEMVFISKDFELFREQIVESDTKHCPFEYAYFKRASSYMFDERVKQLRRKTINLMWEEFKSTKHYSNLMKNKENVLIVPVPRTAESAAIYLQKDQNLPFLNAIEKNPYSPRIFMQPTQVHRNKDTIANHFVYKEEVEGKDVILIEDSIVRGTTMKSLIIYLIDVGVNSLHIFSTFPPVKNPCHDGIDFHTLTELLAPGKSIPQLKGELGMPDNFSLNYATEEILQKASGGRALCDKCYTE